MKLKVLKDFSYTFDGKSVNNFKKGSIIDITGKFAVKANETSFSDNFIKSKFVEPVQSVSKVTK